MSRIVAFDVGENTESMQKWHTNSSWFKQVFLKQVWLDECRNFH